MGKEDELRKALIQARKDLDSLIDNTGEYESDEHSRLHTLIKQLREELYGSLEEV